MDYPLAFTNMGIADSMRLHKIQIGTQGLEWRNSLVLSPKESLKQEAAPSPRRTIWTDYSIARIKTVHPTRHRLWSNK